MKNLLSLFFCILFIGLIAVGCSSPPGKTGTSGTSVTSTSLSDRSLSDRSADQVTAPVMFAQDVNVNLPVPDNPKGVWDFIKDNAAALILGFMGLLKVITNLTPTDKDNKIFGLLDTVINWIIPNLKKGGGTHTEPG